MQLHEALEKRQALTESLRSSPYSSCLYLQRAACYEILGFPDLAAGDAYKALLLTDEIKEESGEFHEQALAAFQEDYGLNGGLVGHRGPELNTGPHRSIGKDHPNDSEAVLALANSSYLIISRCLLACDSLRSAFEFCERGLRYQPNNAALLGTKSSIFDRHRVAELNKSVDWDGHNFEPIRDLEDSGLVRRELYPWNNFEPNRFSEINLVSMNEELWKIAPKISARAAVLPVLSPSHVGGPESIKHLGLFANADIEPGKVLLKEYSLLTANNRLLDTLCDACSTDLLAVASQQDINVCPECEVAVFCSSTCFEAAMSAYHPSVCGMGVDTIGKDTDAKGAADALYLLLVGRAIALAQTQEQHPLELKETKFLWADFLPSGSTASLPFTFKNNILLPLNILEKMGVDIFKTLPYYDTWILNTLFAKFRGVASGRLNRETGRPEVCAVHPFWCLANHSCAPNVRWEWSGDMKLWARSGGEFVQWGGEDAEKQEGGIKEGDQILNHYCDIGLSVQSRREWASGALGGTCMCPRCVWESGEGP